MSRKSILRFLMACAVVLLPAGALAQSAASGGIAGMVKDTTAAVLPGVTVEATSPALIEKVRTVVTDDQGNYKIVDLRPGMYTVTFTLPGFSTVKREGIELSTGFTANVNAEMRVGSLEETVTVSGASPVVDIQNVRTQNVLTRDVLDALPTNKTIQAFAALTVGGSLTASGGAVHDVGGNKGEQWSTVSIHGGRPGDGRLNYDGMRFNNMVGSAGGASRQFFVNQAAVQEVTLETSGMSAESESGGVTLNYVPRDGGNTFRFYANTNYTNEDLQASNLSDSLRARGLTQLASVKKVYDLGLGLGGPIKRDTLWFYTAHRWWGSQEYAPGVFYNKTQSTPFYTPDFSRPGFTDYYQKDHSLRLTWQATRKHRFTGSYSNQKSCNCNLYVDAGRVPEAATDYTYWPVYLAQSTWSYPATNRVLLEAGVSYLHNIASPRPEPGVLPTDISITELSTNIMYNSSAVNLHVSGYGDRHEYSQHNERFSVSYITGSHAFKVGLFALSGVLNLGRTEINESLSYSFRFGVPVGLTQWASPNHTENTLKMNLGAYAQDQWTLKRLTLNLGLRFDQVNAYAPAQHRPAGRFVPAYDFPRADDLPNFIDVNPRMGAAYDLFGDGKTALKVFLGRYVGAMGATLALNASPSGGLVASANRTWNDANGNYTPDCDLYIPGANGECGGLSNSRFGTVSPATRYADDVLTGYGNREYNWQSAVSVQHELRPGTAVNVGYFRTWFGNFPATDNVLVTPADYDSYCITAPVDTRLPGGGGYQLCGLYDIQPTAFGRVDNLVTQTSRFGARSEVYDGLDATIRARFGQGGLLTGGMNVGRTMVDNCAVVDAPIEFCKNGAPFFRPQFKFAGVYPLPLWGLQASATLQSIPGVPIAATYVATNAQIAPSLGRNLGACRGATTCTGTATVTLVEPNTMFEDRLNQLDLRFTKIVRVGSMRVQGMFDIYNIFNANTVLTLISRYGPTWLQPQGVLGARLFKFGAQLDF